MLKSLIQWLAKAFFSIEARKSRCKQAKLLVLHFFVLKSISKNAQANNRFGFIKYLHIVHIAKKKGENAEYLQRAKRRRSDASCLHASEAKEIRQWNCLDSFPKHLHFSKSDIAFIRSPFSARISFGTASREEEEVSSTVSKNEICGCLECLDKIDIRVSGMSILFRSRAELK